MKTKLVRAIVAALIAGTLLLAGTAGYAPPGVGRIVASSSN